MTYEECIQKVNSIIAEPMPHTPAESLATFAQSWIETKLDLGTKIEGIDIPGWDNFNDFTKGFRPHEFSILCGPTGCGKTTLLANIAVHLAAGGTPSFIGSVETGRNDFTRVMAGILANKNPYSEWTQEEVKAVELNYKNILRSTRSVFCKYDSRIPHIQLLADILYAHETFGTKVALIDNLNFLMEITSSKDQLTAMDTAVHDFTVFVKKIGVHVVMVMHPKKTDNGRVVSEFDIKGSSTSVQEASNVILWNRLEKLSDAGDALKPTWWREMKFCKVRKNGRAVGGKILFSIDDNSPQLKEEFIL